MSHHDVFISYSSQNKPVADATCAALEANGIRCWIAPRDVVPGEDWSDAIIDAIADCRVFVLILSAASNQSEQVKREVQNAVGEAKPILPFRIEEVVLSKHMRYFIGTPHWLDALSPPLEHHLERMVETVLGLMNATESKPGAGAPLVAFPPVAPSWDRDVLAHIGAELRPFVGPISSVLVREAATTARDYPDLCRHLAESVLEGGERQTFLDRCRALLPRAPIVVPVLKESESAADAPPPPAPPLDPDLIASAAKVLADYVGPLARILAKRASQGASGPDELYRRLAEQIASPAEKADFLRRVTRAGKLAS